MKMLMSLLVLVVATLCYLTPAFAQVAAATPTPAVAGAVASVVAPAAQSTSGLVAIILAAVACLNVALSAVQQIFSKLAKSEPGWLQSVSKIVLAVTQYLGSNPSV